MTKSTYSMIIRLDGRYHSEVCFPDDINVDEAMIRAKTIRRALQNDDFGKWSFMFCRTERAEYTKEF